MVLQQQVLLATNATTTVQVPSSTILTYLIIMYDVANWIKTKEAYGWYGVKASLSHTFIPQSQLPSQLPRSCQQGLRTFGVGPTIFTTSI